MIVYFNSIDDYEFPITFDELKKRFPNTSFCDPIKQSALPSNYKICDDVIFYENKNTNCKYVWKIKIEDGRLIAYEEEVPVTEKEIQDQMKLVDDLLIKKIEEISWAFQSDTPERIRNKYEDYRNKLYDVYNQKGYPFHIEIPEME